MHDDVTRRVLVIAPAGTPDAALRGYIAEEPGAVELRVVSPASDLSFAQWLANAEDDAWAEAEETAQRAARALAGEAAVVEAGAGDTDPVVAAQDALQTFAADELLVVLPDGESGREATWLERAAVPGFERLGVPVRYMRASGAQE
jgi:hypothetical protein